MKKVLSLMVPFLIITLFFAACSDISKITVPGEVYTLERNPKTIPWTGQGIDSMVCNESGGDYIHWVLNQAKNVSDPLLILSGTGEGECEPDKITPGGVIQFTTPYYELEGLEAEVSYSGSLGNNSQFVISDYCPGEDELEYGILFEEDFTGDYTGGHTIPAGWNSTHPSNWYLISFYNYAGGTVPEMSFYCLPFSSDTFMLKSPAIDTSGYSQLGLSFKHYLNDYAGNKNPYTLTVQISKDGGSSWVDSGWEIVNPLIDIPSVTVNINLDSYAGQSIQIAWVFVGNSYDVNRWSIDDILVDGYY